MRNQLLRKWLKRLAKLYGVFAIANTIYKLFLKNYARLEAKKLWKHLPGKDCDPLARRLRAFDGRFHDFFAEPGLNHPNEAIIRVEAPVPTLMCNTPEAIRWMLKDEFDNVTKPGTEDFLFELMNQFLGSNGIFVLPHGVNHKNAHSMWHKERKVSSLIFTKSNFETLFYDTFVEKANVFLKQLEKKSEKKTDMQELFFSFTMDSIEKFFMGTDVNTIEGGMSEYARSFDTAHQAMMSFLKSSIPAQILCRHILPFPFGTLHPNDKSANSILQKCVNFFNKDSQILQREIQKLNDHVLGYVKKTRSDPNLKERKDIIANFLNFPNGHEFSDTTLRDIVLNLTIAGRDTTACALSWMFFQLTQNLEVQEKLIKEIDHKLKGRTPTISDLEADRMPFLNGVLYETLRLHPPVPTETKRVERTIYYKDGTVIPPGTKLMFSPYSMGRNPTKFPDPMKFDPTRWIPFKQPSLYEFPVFQAGPRFCLGKDMAQFEMKLLVCMLFQKFRFTLLDGEAEKIRYSLMLTQSVANNSERNNLALLCFPHKREDISQ